MLEGIPDWDCLADIEGLADGAPSIRSGEKYELYKEINRLTMEVKSFPEDPNEYNF